MRRTVSLIIPTTFWVILLAPGLWDTPALATVYNLKVVTDASPDYHDMGGMIRSITSKWEEPAEKCRAFFYSRSNSPPDTLVNINAFSRYMLPD